jgi:hypothetical protein
MFVAKDRELKTRVNSLDPELGSRMEELRALTTSGRLVCPGCEQELTLRMGEIRRPHFAHRKVSECPLAKQSADVLEAKAKLYKWLCTKYPGLVEMDVNLQIPDWDRFADLVVHAPNGKIFAYWIFDRSPKNRWGLRYFNSEHIMRNILFAESALHKEADGALRLSAAQRDFIVTSDFDPLRGFGHLHFIEPATGKLTIYRAFHCVCEPNMYTSNYVREAPLASALICPLSGEIVLAEDVEEYRHQMELKKRCGIYVPPIAPRIPPPLKEPPVAYKPIPLKEQPAIYKPQPRQPQPPAVTVVPPEPEWDGFYTCEMCGIRTKETNVILSVRKTCVCPACLPGYNAKHLRSSS